MSEDDDDHETIPEVPPLRLLAPPYPWDLWRERATDAGLDAELAELGRAVMREAFQHVWSQPRRVECGWSDDGAAMITRALAEPETTRARWRELIDTDGAGDGSTEA